jgi:hypothetical protein
MLFAGVHSISGIEFVLPDGVHLGKIGDWLWAGLMEGCHRYALSLPHESHEYLRRLGDLRMAKHLPKTTYAYDIFLSYRRDPETRNWIGLHLVPLITLRVGFELGQPPTISVDDQIESGNSWPLDLAMRLGSSRVLLALWTKTYFNSKWCTQELCHMLAREKITNRRTHAHPKGLIIPAVIHDGEDFPLQARQIQYIDLKECFNVRMSKDSPRAEQLDEIIKKEAPAIAAAIRGAPEWRQKWPKKAAASLYEVFYRGAAPPQATVPVFA